MKTKELWSPSAESGRPLRHFIKLIEDRHNVQLGCDLVGGTYAALHTWSVENYAEFWEAVWDYCEVKYSHKYTQVVDKDAGIESVPRWFSGVRLNYAENLLCRGLDTDVAVYDAGERFGLCGYEAVTRGALKQRVGAVAAGLRRVGVGIGDRVAGYLPNCSETLVAYLATASIGAVWASASPDFGVMGVVERFSQVKPKVLFSCKAVMYNGKKHDHSAKLSEVCKQLPSLEHIVIFPFLPQDGQEQLQNGTSEPQRLPWTALADFEMPDTGAKYEQVEFSHPLAILFSSGTTGKPKCLVHSAGGTLLKHLAEHRLQHCLGTKDRLLFYSTTGWMMWNWEVSVLAVGGAVVLYDGSPFQPQTDHLLRLVDTLGVTALGAGAKIYQHYAFSNLRPRDTLSLASLHSVYSTGSPLSPECYDYLYAHFKADLFLSSISGGTDILGCFLGGSLLSPVYRGLISGPCLGCSIEAWDAEGKSVIGESGDLVCRRPIPSLPIHFLDDEEGIRYKKAYFSKFPGVWWHGDLMRVDAETGGYEMLGRSDGTLNPAGVRFGTAELYAVVEAWRPELINDCLAVAQRTEERDERVILFLQLHPDTHWTEDLENLLRAHIRKELSARHVPAFILSCPDIPYTASGKKVEIAVREIIAGSTNVANEGALRNPEALIFFRDIPQLQPNPIPTRNRKAHCETPRR